MQRKKPVKIPTLAGLAFLVVLMLAGVFFSNEFTPPWGKAASFDIYPYDIRVSKITDSAFVVSYLTEKQTPGFVRIGKKNYYDTRDQASVPGIYKIHYIEIDNLTAKSEVFYTIVSSGRNFPQEAFILPDKIIEIPQVLPLNGEITTKTKKPTAGAIFYLSIDNASLWSTFVYHKPNWLMPLSQVRTADLKELFCKSNNCQDDLKLKIEVLAEEGNSLVVGRLKDLRPEKEPVVIGENLDLTLSLNPTPTVLPTLAQAGSVQGTKIAKEKETKKTWPVEILNPKENAPLPYTKPFIRGLGVPKNEVIIAIESKVKQVGKAKVKDDGTWYFTPAVPLEAGKHLLIVTTKDAGGKNLTLRREFLILKSGESVLSEATASASITPSPIPSPTIYFPPTSALPTPYPTIPRSGSIEESLLLLGAGVFFLFFGLTIL